MAFTVLIPIPWFEALDDLFGSYVRFKDIGIVPVLVADEGLQTTFYYVDLDQNSVELNVLHKG